MSKSAALKRERPQQSDGLSVAVVERRDAPGVWSVEAIDDVNEGDVYSVVFYGPDSESRAREYASLKYGA
jgi:hypothetical protein